MAIITLKPGEAFEHYHESESETSHVKGDLMISFNESALTLSEKQKIIIPANTSHTVKNIGASDATFKCAGHLNESENKTLKN